MGRGEGGREEEEGQQDGVRVMGMIKDQNQIGTHMMFMGTRTDAAPQTYTHTCDIPRSAEPLEPQLL